MASLQLPNSEFLAKAETLELPIGGKTLKVKPREFGSGSVGYGYSGKVEVLIDGKVVRLQASINLVVTGSKPEEEAAAA